MSVSKGIAGIAFNMLIDRGLIDVNLPVAHYWPEFAQNGKGDMPMRYLLDHRSGMPIITDRLWPGAIFDREAMVAALAAQAPLWEPGTTAAYQVTVQGYMLGEIMRRVCGQTFGPFVAREIAGPLGADFLMGGLGKRDQLRCAQLLPNMDAKLLAAKDEDKESLRSRTMVQYPEGPWSDTLNSTAWRESEIASGNGHGTAAGLARIYGAFARGGEVDCIRLCSNETIEVMITEQHHQIEVIQDRHYHQALGILLNTPEAVYMGPNPRAYGHHGIRRFDRLRGPRCEDRLRLRSESIPRRRNQRAEGEATHRCLVTRRCDGRHAFLGCRIPRAGRRRRLCQRWHTR